MEIVDVNTFDYGLITRAGTIPRPRGNHGGQKNQPNYLDLLAAFDIETSYLPDLDQSIMYVWQFAVTSEVVVMGRTWEEFEAFRAGLENAAGGRTLVVWVHNLSYEFQFLAGIYNFHVDDVFALRPRKVLKATMGRLEFRCSYLHSNMSLAKYLEAMQVEHEKQTGYDYKRIRYPWTPLTEDEIKYCVADVVGLVEALAVELEKDHDTLRTIPLTSTGYVRRDAKRQLQPARRSIQSMLPSYELHQLLRQAFRGGNTHASRYMSGYVLRDVTSYDRSSSYPDVILNCKFPLSAWHHIGYMTMDRYNELLKMGKAVLMRVALGGLRLRDDCYPCPYLSRDKCITAIDTECDNGRVLSAGYVELAVTDIDWRIIMDQYQADSIIIVDAWSARYGYLPAGLRQLNIDYYRRKTELKGKADEEYYYNKTKNKLNSIYGMTAENPLRDKMLFECDQADNSQGGFVVQPAGEEEYNKQQNGQWKTYAWGVWVTAWARWRLQEGIDLVVNTPGAEFVYCDTDSVKYTGYVDWTKYNQARQRDSLKSGAYADDAKGKRHYMGVYEHDASYAYFRTWGAKKYAYGDMRGELHVTVSGVNKKLGGQELAAAGGIEAFKPGFVFRLAGGQELRYNDTTDMDVEREGRPLHIGRNVAIRDSTYTLSITSEYSDLIRYAEIDGYALDLEEVNY